MARMYARRRGKSGSKRPLAKATWIKYSKEEVERLVIKLAKDGLKSTIIGLSLRDQYGIPSVRDITKKTITEILNENNLLSKIPEELLNLLKRAVNLRNHMEKNRKDYTSKHGLELVESKIRRLGKYYVRTKKLPKDWKYDYKKAKLIVQTAE